MKRIKLLPELIMLIAGLVTCIVAVVTKMDNGEAVRTLLWVLVGFYCLGLIARFILKKICFSEEVIEENEESGLEEEEPELEEDEQVTTKEQ